MQRPHLFIGHPIFLFLPFIFLLLHLFLFFLIVSIIEQTKHTLCEFSCISWIITHLRETYNNYMQFNLILPFYPFIPYSTYVVGKLLNLYSYLKWARSENNHKCGKHIIGETKRRSWKVKYFSLIPKCIGIKTGSLRSACEVNYL
jgi:hypothetical protein